MRIYAVANTAAHGGKRTNARPTS